MKKTFRPNGLQYLVTIAASLLLFSACVKPPVCEAVSAAGKRKITGQTKTAITTVGNLTGGLDGQSADSLYFTGTDPQTKRLFYAGTYSFTAAGGAFTGKVTGGTLDPATGEYGHSVQFVSGTGAYAGAKGTLSFHGFYGKGLFTDDKVSGEICGGKPRYIK